MLKPSYIRFRIKAHNALYVIEVAKSHDIIMRNFHEVEPYFYEFEVSPRYYFKSKKMFKDSFVISRHGYFSWLQNLIIKKTTIIALIISSIGFFDLSSRIFSITVNGTNRKINAQITEKLSEIGVKKWMRKPNYDKLMDYENTLKKVFHNEVEFLELRIKGVDVNIKYTTRRCEVQIPQEGNAIYAKKDGFISYFIVSSGEIVVKENQYVQQGQLLINDRIIAANKEEIIIGAYGSVYAKTWTIIEVSRSIMTPTEEIDAFSELLNKAQSMMASGFINDEKILEQNVLLYDVSDSKISLRVHFTCLEDLAN